MINEEFISKHDGNAFIRNIPTPVLLIEEEKIREISDHAARLFGQPNPDQCIGMRLSELIHSPDFDKTEVEERLRHVYSQTHGGTENHETIRVNRSDGSTRVVQLSFSGFHNAGNNAVILTIKDNTDDSAVFENYQSLLQKDRAVFQNNPALMSILDTSYRIIDVNNAWIHLSGYSRDQLLSMHLDDFSVVSRSGDTITRAIKEKIPISGEMILNTPKGNLALIYHYSPIISDSGECESILAVYFDVTENRRLQRKNQLMIEKNPTLFFILDRNLQVKEANPAWVTVSGYSREELLSMKLTDFEVYERAGGNIMDAFAKGVEVSGELGVRVPKGKMHLKYHYVPFIGEDGSIDEILAAYFDVTSLNSLARRNKVLIEKNPTLFFILDRELRITEANPVWEKVSGYTREDLLSMKLTDFKVYERVGGNFMDTFTKGEETTGELGVEVPKGKLHLKFHYVPLPSEDGEVKEILAAYFDITLMKTLERKNQTIIENNPGLIFILDKDLRIIRANKTWVSLSGYSLDELLSMKLTDFKVFDRKGEDFRLAFTKGISVSGEFGVETPRKKLHLTAYYIPIPEEDGAINEVLAVYFDISEIRELEQRLQKSMQELAETLSSVADRDLSVEAPIYDGDPLYNVKKDLNTSVAAINLVLSSILIQGQSLAQSIEDISAATTDLTQGSQQVARISQEVSNGITEQLSEVDRVSIDITNLSASIEEITASAQDVLRLIAQIAENGNLAVQQGNDATGKMKIVEQISREATNQIISLNNRMNEVGKIVQMIGDIANQTNLLALNAAIEAARAGEHGRGFAVVAGEVKNLAGESKLATGNIEELISSLMKESEVTANSMKNAFEAIISGADSVNNALSSLNQISHDIGIAEESVSEITKATEDQADEAVNEEKKMTGLAAVAEQSSASTEEIASASGEIRDMAKELKKQVEMFTL